MTGAYLELVVHLYQPVYEDCTHVLVDVSLHVTPAVRLCQMAHLLLACCRPNCSLTKVVPFMKSV